MTFMKSTRIRPVLAVLAAFVEAVLHFTRLSAKV